MLAVETGVNSNKQWLRSACAAWAGFATHLFRSPAISNHAWFRVTIPQRLGLLTVACEQPLGLCPAIGLATLIGDIFAARQIAARLRRASQQRFKTRFPPLSGRVSWTLGSGFSGGRGTYL